MGGRKTRIQVTFDGEARELFAIEENGSGDLTITRVPGNKSVSGLHRTSVHCSPHSTGTLIKHTITDPGCSSTAAQFIKDSKASLIAHVVTQLMPKLDERFSSRAKARDTIVNLLSFAETDWASLIYTLFVTDPRTVLPKVAGFNRKLITFRRFTVVLYYGLANFPAADFAPLGLSTSSPTLVNGEPQRYHHLLGVRIEAPSGDGNSNLPIEAVESVVLERSLFASGEFLRSIIENVPPDRAKSAERLRKLRIWFHQDAADLTLGRIERGTW